MKKYLIPVTIVASSFYLMSCGDKESETSKEGSKQEATAQKQGSHNAVKAALKSQVNSVTADVMLKVPSFIDLPPAQYNMPDSLEGRDLVQVSVKWPMVAKEDLYSLDSILHDLPTKPSVINLEYSKGDQVEYIESNYVLAADGGGGYVLQNSRFVKQSFEFPDVETKSTLGKSLLIKGSDEHLTAAKEAAAIKQAADEKKRIAKAEAETKKLTEVKAKVDQLLTALEKEGEFKGSLAASRNGESVSAQFKLKIKSISTVADETRVRVDLVQFYYGVSKQIHAVFEGGFDQNGELKLLNTQPGKNGGYSQIWDLMDESQSPLALSYAGHIDKIKVTGMSRHMAVEGTLLRR